MLFLTIRLIFIKNNKKFSIMCRMPVVHTGQLTKKSKNIFFRDLRKT